MLDDIRLALLDLLTTDRLTAFRANMILRDYGVQRWVKALHGPTEITIGVGMPGGVWQWGTAPTVAMALGVEA